MNSQLVVDLLRQALLTAFWVAAPILAIGCVVGILISLLQIVTSVQDPAVGAVPRLITFLLGILLLLPWMINKLTTYTAELIQSTSRYVH